MLEKTIKIVIIIAIIVTITTIFILDKRLGQFIPKKEKQKRSISNKKIKENLKYIDNKLKDKSFLENDKFEIPIEIEREIKYSRYSDKAIDKLVKLILKHMNLEKDKIDVKVINKSSKEYLKYVGLYQEFKDNTNKITIIVTRKYNYENIVATVIHECTHHFLFKNKIKYKDVRENEILTDIATIYLGFSEYMIQGYQKRTIVNYKNEFTRLIDDAKIGYVTSKDLQVANKILKKMTKY